MLLTLWRRKGGRVPDYGNTPDALSGNEYELGSPCVPGVKLHLSDGGVLTVRTRNWSPSHVYVKAVYLNGVKLKGTTIRYQDIKDGADLLFVMR